ncbi:riboflavin kinase/FMN adenylyltransferase [Bacilli bacterium PM5-3]|nr:riboflavin kinase/FMN adenylyltransferase [Bacilli bacterium PM5-3]MDH6603551.1 riboflavin kinase/FMN adenylyltransferase [Bacilli bacterium PM5-9]
MEIIHLRNDDEISQLNNEYAVAIGNFDGVHLGHREVIKKAVKLASSKNMKAGVMCFDVTPRQLVNKIDNYYMLRSFEQKKEILEELGIETIFLIHFNDKIKNLSPQEFVEKMIISSNIKYLVCGYDFAFGKNKAGNATYLQQFSEFKTIILPRIEINHDKVSSTLINELLSHGSIQEANRLLVKPYSIIGKVIAGNQKGRMIGFPTANVLPLVNYRIPQSGVYATRVIVNDKEYYGMTNIGHNPTFNFSCNTSVETNIFDFDEDIYGCIIEIIFIKYIRKEKIFDDVDDLVRQLNKDKQDIIDFFNEK